MIQRANTTKTMLEILGIIPHEYQRFAANFVKMRSGCGLFFDMGLGKTLITLIALLEGNPSGHVLVIAPKTIARSTWVDEIKKWKMPFRIQSLIVNENDKQLTAKKRHALYVEIANAPPTVYFINQELIIDLIKHLPVKDDTPVWPFPFVIVDELQAFKSNKSERFKALCEVRPQIKWFLGLTGTPAPNGLMDIWSQIYLMDGGQRLGRNITAYRNTYFNPGLTMNGYPVKWHPKPGAEDAIYAAIADIVISQKNTVIKLPPLTINDIYVYMSPNEMQRYKELAKHKVLAVGIDEEGEDINIIAKNAAVLHGKLLQMASGSIYIDENHNYEVIHEQKLEHCKHIIENTGSSVLIAYHYKSELDMLLKYLEPYGVQAFNGSKQMIDDWNNKQIPVMLVQPASAGHGINLQKGGHTLVWYSLPESLAEYAQLNARLYRQGQEADGVIIHRLITDGTLDARVPGVLEKKDALQNDLLDAVKLELQAILQD